MFSGLRKKLNRMGIASRLVLSFVLIIALLVAVAVQSNLAMRQADEIHRVNTNYVFARRELAYRIQGEFSEFRFRLRSSFMSASWRDAVYRHERRHYARLLGNSYWTLISLADEYMELALNDPFISDEHKEEIYVYVEQVKEYFSHVYYQFLNHFFPGSDGTNYIGNVTHYMERADAILDGLIEITRLSANEVLLETDAIIRNSMNIIIVLVAAAVVLAGGLAYLMIKTFIGRVHGVENYLLKLQENGIKAEGTDKFDDELSRIVSNMVSVLKDRELESVKRAQLMFDATPVQIEFWSKEGICVDCNQATLASMGEPDKEKYLANYDAIVFAPDASGKNPWEGWHEAVNEAFETGNSRFDCFKYEEGKKAVYYDCIMQSVMFDDEPIVISYTRDLTHQKEVEMAQRKALLAEQNSVAKSRFLARMSHEIRTPLTAVLGIAEIQLQNPSIQLVAEEAFAKIYNSATVLLSLVNDILDLSRIEANKLNIVNKPYEVASMVADIVQMHMIYLGSKKIEFRVDTDENLPAFLIGDELRIRQILNNLLSNAFKYTDSGEVELSLRRLRHESPNKITLKLRIRDTGYGMKPEHLKNLTEEYARFHEKELSLVEGTGLGMPIVYSLVTLMGGSMDIESEVGAGTSVIIHLPQDMEKEETIGAEAAANLMSVENLSASLVKRVKFIPEPMPYGRVLIVDDIDTNLYVARGLLMFYDLQIDTCTSGREAIALISAGKSYDVIFMDQMMPEMDGTTATAELRKMGYTRPIIALTANALIGQAEVFLATGFDGFLSKPIQAAHLNGILCKFIRDKQTPEVLEAAAAARAKETSGINNFLNREMGKLKTDFYNGQKNTVKNIRGALENGDYETAHRLVHTLKGLAGLIKEGDLAKSSYEAEKLIRQGKISEPELLALEQNLENILSEIEKTINQEPEAQGMAKEAQSTLLDKLQALLAENDAACLQLTDELKKIPETKVLVKLIEDFSFETAKLTLETMRAVLEI